MLGAHHCESALKSDSGFCFCSSSTCLAMRACCSSRVIVGSNCMPLPSLDNDGFTAFSVMTRVYFGDVEAAQEREDRREV